MLVGEEGLVIMVKAEQQEQLDVVEEAVVLVFYK